MVPLYCTEKNSTTEYADLYPDFQNPRIMIIKMRHQKLLNVKDIPTIFGQIKITYKDSVMIDDQEFVNEFKIIGWYFNQDTPLEN